MSNIIEAADYKEPTAYEQLLENHHLETYDEYAGILKKMSEAVKEMLEMPDEKDAVEKNNLKTLAELLPICSDLFINCDPYYRH